MSDLDFVTAPLRLLSSKALFSGVGTGPGPVISDLDEAMTLANQQDIPPQYCIWADVQSQAEATFFSLPQRDQADRLLDPILSEFDLAAKPARLALRKAKLRKTLTPYEEFVSILIGDISIQLKSVGLARYCFPPNGEPVFEAIFAAYNAGFYPCGWHREAGLISFDPSVLEVHRQNPFAD